MKIKILVIIYPKLGGCQFYRQLHPHEGLKGHPRIEITYQSIFLHLPDEKYLKYDLVQFHKNFVSIEILKKLKELGVKTMVDFDDYWHLPQNHISYYHYKKNNQSLKLLGIVKNADYISTSTLLLANEIKKHNVNVYVFPNTLSINIKQFERVKVAKPNLQIGYIGGSCHLPDIELLRGINNKLSNSGLKYTFNLFGYKDTGAYFDYACVISDNGRFLENINLIPSLDVPDYLYFYHMINVSLAPLLPNKFNSMKSELKLVEAGMFKCPVISSNVPPYKPYLVHKKNSMVAEYKTDWFKNIKYLVKNPNAVIDYGNQLFEDIQKNFNYEKITALRAETYQNILKTG